VKLFRHDTVIRVVTIIYPQVNDPVLSANGALHRDDLAFELLLKRSLMQNFEVEGFGFEGIDLPAGFYGSCQNGRRIADVCADIQDVPPSEESGKGLHQIPQIVFDIALIEEVGRFE
jgi:hypothetical protein